MEDRSSDDESDEMVKVGRVKASGVKHGRGDSSFASF